MRHVRHTIAGLRAAVIARALLNLCSPRLEGTWIGEAGINMLGRRGRKREQVKAATLYNFVLVLERLGLRRLLGTLPRVLVLYPRLPIITKASTRLTLTHEQGDNWLGDNTMDTLAFVLIATDCSPR